MKFNFQIVLFLLGIIGAVQHLPSAMADDTASPEIVAHRGASFDAPENTLPAFKLAWEQGADAIEGDFFLTKDDVIVCTHDKDNKRVTEGRDERKVAECTFEELRKLDVGSWKGEQWKGVMMPSLTEVLATVPVGKTFLIEIKCGPEIVPVLKQTLAEAKANPEQLRIIAFNAEVIAECRQALPEIKAFWLTSFSEEVEGSGEWKPTWDSIMETLARTKASGLDCNAHAIVDAPLVERLRKADQEFHVWTVDDPAVATRFSKLGVDSITTNRPAFLRAQLNQLKEK